MSDLDMVITREMDHARVMCEALVKLDREIAGMWSRDMPFGPRTNVRLKDFTRAYAAVHELLALIFGAQSLDVDSKAGTIRTSYANGGTGLLYADGDLTEDGRMLGGRR